MIRKKTNTRPGWSDNMLFNKTVAGKLTNKKSTEKRKTNLANDLMMCCACAKIQMTGFCGQD